MLKKSICLLLLIAFCISLTACGVTPAGDSTQTTASQATTQASPGTSAPSEETKIFAPNSVTVSVMLPYEVSWPYNENWFVKKTIEEETNVKLDIMTVEVSSQKYDDKFNLIVASGEMPDMIFQYNGRQANIYAQQGAFIAVEDYYDKAPNLKKFVDENPDLVVQYLASNGKLYTFPGKGQGVGNRRHWIYRKDIFEKNNLTVPTTSDELYDVCKKLKELYPDTYPIASRKTGGIELMCPSWNAQDYEFYDWDNNVFKFGPAEPEYKSFLEFYNKLIVEELTPPDVLTIGTQAWVDLFAQEKSFITMDYVTRMDSVGAAGRENNLDFQLAYMPPINGVTGYTTFDYSCYVVPANSKNIDNAVKLLDWFYTPKAIEYLSWGKEGQTYKVENGEKKYLSENYLKDHGLTAAGWGIVFDEDALTSGFGAEGKIATKDAPKYEIKCNPFTYMQMTEEENEIKTTLGADIWKHKQENVAKFILGQRSFSEWDDYLKELENIGLTKVLDTYTKAYERYK